MILVAATIASAALAVPVAVIWSCVTRPRRWGRGAT